MRQITSPANPHVKAARRLRRRRQRERSGLCLLEGPRLIADAWRHGARFEQVFVTEELLAHPEHRPWIQAMERAGVWVAQVSPQVLAGLSHTVTPQGMVAVVHQPRHPLPPSPWMVLVLDGLQDPGNAGTLIRSAAAAGADGVLFGPGSVDPYNEKVLRAAMGAHFRLPVLSLDRWESLWELLASPRPLYIADPAGHAVYDRVDWTQPGVLVVGGEAHGPSAPVRAMGIPVAIPMARNTESLNAAVAGSVILFEAARQRRRARARASAADPDPSSRSTEAEPGRDTGPGRPN